MPAPDASNAKLRELLNVSDGGAGDELRRNAVAKITLAAFLGADRRHSGRAEMSRTLLDIIEDESASGAQMSRTLLDIIRDESAGGAAVYGAHLGPNHATRNSWKSFKYRLGLRRGGASSWTGGPVQIPAPGVPISHSSRTNGEPAQPGNTALPIQNHPGAPAPAPAALTRPGQIALNSDVSTRNESSPQRGAAIGVVPECLGDVLAAERERLSDAGEEGVVEEADGEPSARMSLMALLEETDRQMGVEGPAAYSEYDEYEVEDGGGGSGVDGIDSGHSADHNCCVCMVRHKGAAFIPCGHTFCRLCSRELWVNRGNCPVCNSYILEILDIF